MNILEDIFGVSGYIENLFYLQLFLNNDHQPWQLILDNDAAHMFADEYKGVFALNALQYYTLRPISRIKGKNGPRKVWMDSVLGYEIFDSRNRSVAAVSLVDHGNVYFHTSDKNERFLMANLIAALLLQQDLAER